MKLNDYQQKIEETWISNENDSIRIVLGIGGESGELLEKFKKYYRGDYNDKKTEFNDSVRKEIGDLSFYIAKLCNRLGVNWEDVLQENIDKLQSRKNRGKIKGSGDSR